MKNTLHIYHIWYIHSHFGNSGLLHILHLLFFVADILCLYMLVRLNIYHGSHSHLLLFYLGRCCYHISQLHSRNLMYIDHLGTFCLLEENRKLFCFRCSNYSGRFEDIALLHIRRLLELCRDKHIGYQGRGGSTAKDRTAI